MEVVLLKSFRHDLGFRRHEQTGVLLLRPDGYVAYASAGASTAQALAAVRAVLARQLRHDLS